MNQQDLERLETRIRNAENTLAKSQGVMEQIEASWKETYGTADPEKIREILNQQEEQLRTLNANLEEAVSGARALLDRAGVS